MRRTSVLHPPSSSDGQGNDLVDLGDGRRARLLSLLGKGASASTYRALLVSPTGLSRQVALKLFAPVSSEDADRLFGLAARTALRAAAVRHPNVVELYDFGQWRMQPFYVTELVDGVNLHALVQCYAERQQRLPLDLALFIAVEVAEALSGARTARDHRGMQVSMLHLSLGATKILLGFRGEVKVSDFEASLVAGASSSIRSMRAVAGRAATMPPEVAQGRVGDARSDVFSLGVVLREMFVGPRFAKNVTDAEAVRLAREGFVQPIPFQPHLPEALVSIMTRALHLDPKDRYPNATALAFDLRRVALAMGVGDGRLFLRRALDREFGNDTSEVTTEHLGRPAPEMRTGEGCTLRVAGDDDLAALRNLDALTFGDTDPNASLDDLDHFRDLEDEELEPYEILDDIEEG
ncbi:MAG: serine/threonine protein kinase [Deltaproteobacteria bacterium]|nr:serine/threonine protein kinase [Deltaproteobacteria bacterium]